jgi:hypothetical protein
MAQLRRKRPGLEEEKDEEARPLTGDAAAAPAEEAGHGEAGHSVAWPAWAGAGRRRSLGIACALLLLAAAAAALLLGTSGDGAPRGATAVAPEPGRGDGAPRDATAVAPKPGAAIAKVAAGASGESESGHSDEAGESDGRRTVCLRAPSPAHAALLVSDYLAQFGSQLSWWPSALLLEGLQREVARGTLEAVSWSRGCAARGASPSRWNPELLLALPSTVASALAVAERPGRATRTVVGVVGEGLCRCPRTLCGRVALHQYQYQYQYQNPSQSQPQSRSRSAGARHLPLGPRLGFGSAPEELRAQAATSRRYLAALSGDAEGAPAPAALVASLARLQGARVFAGAAALAPGRLKQVLLDSALTLCPSRLGESHCIYEAVESGSVPVVASDEAGAAGEGQEDGQCGGAARDALAPLRGAPFAWLESWEQLPALLARLASPEGQHELAQLQRKLAAWRERFWTRARVDLECAVMRGSGASGAELARFCDASRAVPAPHSASPPPALSLGGSDIPDVAADVAAGVVAVAAGSSNASGGGADYDEQQQPWGEQEAEEEPGANGDREQTQLAASAASVSVSVSASASATERSRQPAALPRQPRARGPSTGSGNPGSTAPVPLVTGCGRSGTLSVANYLASVGIAAVHEQFRPGSVSVSWLYAVPSALYPFEHAKSRLNRRDMRLQLEAAGKDRNAMFGPVVSLVRHPLKVISSTRRCFCGRGDRSLRAGKINDERSWRFVETHVPRLNKFSALEDEVRSAVYWLEWNKLIDKSYPARKLMRLEALDPNALVAALGFQAGPLPTEIPNDNPHASPAKEKERLPDVTWDQLDRADAFLAREVFDLAQAYGYEAGRTYEEALRQGAPRTP